MYADFLVDLSEGKNNTQTKLDPVVNPNYQTGGAQPVNNPSTGKLELYEEFLAFLIINFYEYFLGLVVGFFFNYAMFKTIPFKEGQNIFGSFMILTVLVSIIISLMFILRKSSQYLPYVDKAFEKGLKHPPPVAITFSLWRTLHQIKLYSKYIIKKFYNIEK